MFIGIRPTTCTCSNPRARRPRPRRTSNSDSFSFLQPPPEIVPARIASRAPAPPVNECCFPPPGVPGSKPGGGAPYPHVWIQTVKRPPFPSPLSSLGWPGPTPLCAGAQLCSRASPREPNPANGITGCGGGGQMASPGPGALRILNCWCPKGWGCWLVACGRVPGAGDPGKPLGGRPSPVLLGLWGVRGGGRLVRAPLLLCISASGNLCCRIVLGLRPCT